MSNSRKLPRRSLLLGLAGMAASSQGISTLAQNATPQASPDAMTNSRPDPIDVGMGILITDIRMIPGSEPPSYLIEFQNNRDDIIDSPTIGVILPDAPDIHSFSWAAPWNPVMPPGASNFGIGLLPTPDSDVESGEWVICNTEVGPGPKAEEYTSWDWELHYNVEILDETSLLIPNEITNTGEIRMQSGELHGIVRDKGGRICGGVPITNMYNLAPGETVERSIGLNANWGSIANPFPLCETSTEMIITIEVQPRGFAIQHACPIVMPWNR